MKALFHARKMIAL